MDKKLIRVGTTYLPVQDVPKSADWYVENLGAKLNYMDSDKAILDFANQSFFLVNAMKNQRGNFYDASGKEHFSCTFEVDGLENLKILHNEFLTMGIEVGEIEDRGHTGRNFVFYDLNGNKFDVWSELSSEFKRRHNQ
ncbi:VOC family protein [Ornithinibacillus salinisoli]|uniref:VOC family protein n=1 Tax=Ornithinibacillus salinisoli TaxID=1848459 RepID=A0ABW4VYH2_9BACI